MHSNMQNPINAAWPMAFFPPPVPGMLPPTAAMTHPSGTSSKPRVGLGVICRCRPQSYVVECLLLKRGPKFVSPLKWSFPGGRLEEAAGGGMDGGDGAGGSDQDDDGERCTIRELKKECGGGSPGGFPPLIHIESYKAGKTLYHVFVIDCEAQPAWLSWQPSVTSEHTGEIDQSASELILQGKKYPAANGFCWIDLQTLIEECMAVNSMDHDKSELQHGLIRWVKANGENILKMLMARSPKLERHRRYPSTGSTSMIPGKGLQSGGNRPRSGSAGSRTRKPPQENHLFSATPVLPGQQVFRLPDHFGGNLPPGGAPVMQMTMSPSLAGAIPEFLKHQHHHSHSMDHNSQQQQLLQVATGGDHAPHLYHSPTTGLVHIQPVPNESTTPTQSSSQHSPVKTPGNEEKQIGGSGFVPFDGTTTMGGGESSVETLHHHQLPPPGPQFNNTATGGGASAVGGGGGAGDMILQQFTGEYDPQQYQPPLSLPHPPPHPHPQQGGGGGASEGGNSLQPLATGVLVPPIHSEQQPSRHPHNRRNDVCRNYLNGHCLYGEKCWFVHSDQKPHREPLLGPGGIMNTGNVAMVPPQPGMFTGGPGMGIDQYIAAAAAAQYSSPKSPLSGANSTGTSPATWQMPGIVNRPPPTMFPFVQRGIMGGAQPQVLLRPFMYQQQNRFSGPLPNEQQLMMAGGVHDPILRFRLLSEGMARDSSSECLVANISSLCVKADHYFVSFQKYLHDYRILFGSDRPGDNHHLAGEQSLDSVISCLHLSKITPYLLVIGTANESVYTFDTKRNTTSNPLTPVYEPQQSPTAADSAVNDASGPGASITALVHFTTIAAAQVVVAGNSKGEITWYIAQPPMKAFTVLAYQEVHIPNPVVCLQILGGCLVSGSSNGSVCLWNMRTQEPVLVDRFQAHTDSLLNIHVLDSSCFITVGVNTSSSEQQHHSSSNVVSSSPLNEKQNAATHETADLTLPAGNPQESNIDETLSTGLTGLSLSTPLHMYSVSLWEYGKPIKNFKTLDNLGPVTCSTFYQHPLLGNRFLALGLMAGSVKIYNLPSFSLASEIHFQDIADRNCCHIALNLSRDKEHTHNFNIKNPFRDLILTTVWTDGRIMVCQIDPRKVS